MEKKCKCVLSIVVTLYAVYLGPSPRHVDRKTDREYKKNKNKNPETVFAFVSRTDSET